MSFYIISINGEENIEISEEMFERLILLKVNYSSLLRMEEIYSNLIKNYRELEIEVFKMSLDSIIYRDYSWSTFKNRIHETDRILINLLTHTRMFLDRSCKIIESVYGKESKERKYFRKLKTSRYDSNFSYRLMEALRNYVIHKDLPIGSLSLNFNTVNVNGVERKVADCSPKLNLELIKSDKEFKPAIRKELENYQQLDLRYHIRSFVSDLSNIHRMFNDYQNEYIQGIISELLKTKELFKNPSNVIGVRILDSESANGCNFSFDMLDRMDELLKLNATYHQIDKMLIMM